MPSVSIIHYTHKVNSDGTSPIVIQVIDSKPKKRTLANVMPNQWDDKKKRVIPKTHPNYAAINIKISDEYNRIENMILSNTFNLQVDFLDYFDLLKKGIAPQTFTDSKIKTFAEIVPLYISSLKSGQSMIAYEAKLNYFIKEAKIGQLRLSEITKSHIDCFIKFMAGKGNMRSTMRTNLKIVRFAATFAQKNGYDTKPACITDFALPKAERSLKRKLDKTELTIFKGFDLSGDDNKRKAEIQDMFMLAFFLRGMRIGDVIQLRQEYFKDGRIVYDSGKNQKLFNIKLVPEAMVIVNKYLDGREYLFHFFKWGENKSLSDEQNKKGRAKAVKNITADINGKLKQIGKDAGLTKNVSTHIARHTFAKMAIDKVKDFNLSMDLIGHSNISEHEKYIREISMDDDLDAAADTIFS